MSSEKLIKSLIVDNIYNKTSIQRRVVHEVVDLFLEEVKGALGRGTVVELRGFGTFEIHTREAREKVRNPKTGKLFFMEKHGVVFFRPGRELKGKSWLLRR